MQWCNYSLYFILSIQGVTEWSELILTGRIHKRLDRLGLLNLKETRYINILGGGGGFVWLHFHLLELKPPKENLWPFLDTAIFYCGLSIGRVSTDGKVTTKKLNSPHYWAFLCFICWLEALKFILYTTALTEVSAVMYTRSHVAYVEMMNPGNKTEFLKGNLKYMEIDYWSLCCCNNHLNLTSWATYMQRSRVQRRQSQVS